MKNKEQVVFFYDRLMTTKTHELLRLPIRFLSFGRIFATLHWVYDGIERRYFVLPSPNVVTQAKSYWIYGGIFLIKDFTNFSKGIYGFCNCSYAYANSTLEQDYYKPSIQEIESVKFNSFKSLMIDDVQSLGSVTSITMVGNTKNKQIQRRAVKNNVKVGMDVPNILELIQEVNNGKNI